MKTQIEKDTTLKVYIEKYVKKEYEVRNYFNNLLVSFSNINVGVTVDQKLIESCLAVEESKKNYVKGVQKSITSTLTGKDSYINFRLHPQAKNRIVLISELGKYLDIGKKNRTLKCPICETENIITKKNLIQILEVKEKTFIYKCEHTENPDFIGKEYYKKNIENFLLEGYSMNDKSMFVLNNFTGIVSDAF